jgi:hypothetical protein
MNTPDGVTPGDAIPYGVTPGTGRARRATAQSRVAGSAIGARLPALIDRGSIGIGAPPAMD